MLERLFKLYRPYKHTRYRHTIIDYRRYDGGLERERAMDEGGPVARAGGSGLERAHQDD